MDRNIKYVRDNRIAGLLNDMVMHLLAVKPDSEPIDVLITYLEKRAGPVVPAPPSAAKPAPEDQRPARNPTPPAAEAKSEAPPTVPETHDPQESTADTNGKDPNEKEEEQIAKPSVAEPPVTKKALAPKPQKDEVDSVLKDIIVAEREFQAMLAQVASDQSELCVEDRNALRTAIAQSENTLKTTLQVSRHHQEIHLAMDHLRSSITDGEYYLLSGFRLLHEMSQNERDLIDALHIPEPESLDADEVRALTQAQSSHREIKSLLHQVEMCQLELAKKKNSGVVNNSLVQFAEQNTSDITAVVGALKKHLDDTERKLPKGTISHETARDPTKLPEDAQAHRVLSELSALERDNIRMLEAHMKAHQQEDDAEALKLAGQTAKELLNLTNLALIKNTEAYGKLPKTYRQTQAEIQGVTKTVQASLDQSHGAFTSALMKAIEANAFSTAEKLKEENGKLRAALGNNTQDEEVARCLKSLDEMDRVALEVAEMQQRLSKRTIALC